MFIIKRRENLGADGHVFLKWETAELSLLRRDRIVAFARGHAVTLVSSPNLDLAKPSIPVCVVGIISEAVLMVQLFRDLIEGVGDLVHAAGFHQPASGFFSQLS